MRTVLRYTLFQEDHNLQLKRMSQITWDTSPTPVNKNDINYIQPWWWTKRRGFATKHNEIASCRNYLAGGQLHLLLSFSSGGFIMIILLRQQQRWWWWWCLFNAILNYKRWIKYSWEYLPESTHQQFIPKNSTNLSGMHLHKWGTCNYGSNCVTDCIIMYKIPINYL